MQPVKVNSYHGKASLQSKARGHFQAMRVHRRPHRLHVHELHLCHSPFTVPVSRRSLPGQETLP